MSEFNRAIGIIRWMRKGTLWVALPVMTLFCSAFIGRGERVPIGYRTDDIAIDGRADDWSDMPLHSITDTLPRTVYRNTFRTAFAWDEHTLYVLFDVSDGRLCAPEGTDDSARIHLNDGVEFWIDAGNDSRGRIDVNDFHFIIDLQNSSRLFRGDKLVIQHEPENTVPQVEGNTPLAYQYAVRYTGSINNNNDRDSGYCVELAIPWAGLGIQAEQGAKVRIDACMNDQDSTALESQIWEFDMPDKRYFPMSWTGIRDYGFPDNWLMASLTGEADALTALSRKYSSVWLVAFIATVCTAVVAITWLAYRIMRLRQLPRRDDLVLQPDTDARPVPATTEERPAEVAPPHHSVQKARTYIEQHIDEPLTTEMLADNLAMSTRGLQRLMKEEVGCTPSNFIHIVRLEHAAAMLAARQGNVSEIAYAVGYNDSAHFSRLFKRYYGVAPSQYAQRPNGAEISQA